MNEHFICYVCKKDYVYRKDLEIPKRIIQVDNEAKTALVCFNCENGITPEERIKPFHQQIINE